MPQSASLAIVQGRNHPVGPVPPRHRVAVLLPLEQALAVERFRTLRRLPSQAEAIRILLSEALSHGR